MARQFCIVGFSADQMLDWGSQENAEAAAKWANDLLEKELEKIPGVHVAFWDKDKAYLEADNGIIPFQINTEAIKDEVFKHIYFDNDPETKAEGKLHGVDFSARGD